MDAKWEKVSNLWILGGWVVSLLICVLGSSDQSLWMFFGGTLVPVLVLFPLFVCRMLGTGDIKVFAVLGSAMGMKNILLCIGISFALGAVVSIPILIFRCNAKERFVYFFTYLNTVFATGTFPPYLAPGKRPENIHFAVMIFCSVMLLMLGGTIYES
ncbi:MAG: prepilin peptidase [Clostridia bacterium]|nr:prepilin peptidase [Clostridia bacterium]NCC44005.1 prepilin peptidase [Clostridia bacterium]